MRITRSARDLSATLALVAACAAPAAVAQGALAPSEDTVSGDYGYSAGTAPDTTAVDGKRWQLGSFHADGAGNINGTRMVTTLAGVSSTGRTRYTQTFTGTYTVDPSGIGTATVTFTPPTPPYNNGGILTSFSNTERLDFAILDGGRELQMLIDLVSAPPAFAVHYTSASVAKRQSDPCAGETPSVKAFWRPEGTR